LKQRSNCATSYKTAPLVALTLPNSVRQHIQSEPRGLTLAELLTQHPALARRTVQRWVIQWLAVGLIAVQPG